MSLSFLGKTQTNLDSLWQVWEDSSEEDTTRMEALKTFTWKGYLFSQPDTAFELAELLYKYAHEIDDDKYRAMALHTQGISFYVGGNYSKASVYYKESLIIRKRINDKRGIAASLNNLGIIYKEQGAFDKAIEYYNASLKIREELNDENGVAGSLNNIGNIYLSIYEYEKAIKCYKKSSIIYQKMGYKKGIAAAHSNIGNIYTTQGKYEKALDHHRKGLKIREEMNSKQEIAISVINIGRIYSDQENHEKAKEYYERGLSISDSINYKKGKINSLVNLGYVHREMKDYEKAISYCEQGIVLARELGAIDEIKDMANTLYKSYEALGKTKEAFAMYKLYIVNRDSILSKENQREIIQQEIKYAFEKQATADSIKNEEAQKMKDLEIEAEKAKNQKSEQQTYFLYGIIVLTILFGAFIFNRFRVTRIQNKIIEEQKNEVDKAYSNLEEKNTEILDSINYAKRIQSAILPTNTAFEKYFSDFFILYKPKDIVAGDFYWLEHKDGKVLFAAADCTGHGVPGAMVSVICNNGLNRTVREHGITEPGKILDKTREIVIEEFEKSDEEVKDGMDIALCSLEGRQLQYAGAHNALWLIREGELVETKADKQPIGKFDNPLPYTTHNMKLEKGDTLYLFTDGYVDQFGGEKGKKFKVQAFRELLLSIKNKTMEEQKAAIDSTFENWKGNLEQIDDVCIMAIRI